jgi:hypothetical protein
MVLEERDKLRQLVKAVAVREFLGEHRIECDDINGVNWFDLRDEITGGKDDE